MKRTIIAFLIICTGAFGAAAQTPELKTELDSVSYYLGVDVGTSVGRVLDRISMDAFVEGARYGMDLPEDFDNSEYYDFLREYFNVRLPERKQKEAEEYLGKIAERSGIRRTDSGLLYEIIEQGDMNFRAVDDNDGVEVIYTGTLADGTVFDSNDEGVVFQLNRVIPGWAEGVKLVGKGGRIILYVPPALGYGANGHSNRIPANSVLIFDVTVLDAPEV